MSMTKSKHAELTAYLNLAVSEGRVGTGMYHDAGKPCCIVGHMMTFYNTKSAITARNRAHIPRRDGNFRFALSKLLMLNDSGQFQAAAEYLLAHCTVSDD